MGLEGLSVLLLEDNPVDAMLINRQLAKLEPYRLLHVVKTAAQYIEKLTISQPDVILADYHLPTMTGLEALNIARDMAPLTPFIFVTGTIEDEQIARETILKDAFGFVLKNNLEQIPETISQALNKQSGWSIRQDWLNHVVEQNREKMATVRLYLETHSLD